MVLVKRSTVAFMILVALVAGAGLGAWGASLVELPLLGVAPPVWRQEPEAIANDAAFHVIYGVATAAALGVLAR